MLSACATLLLLARRLAVADASRFDARERPMGVKLAPINIDQFSRPVLWRRASASGEFDIRSDHWDT
eukprot:9562576-Lingulodinium_polyedra.AAC.1